MNNLLNEIEKKCNLCVMTQIAGINFELACLREMGKEIFLDMIQYLPNDEIDSSNKKSLKLFYIKSEAIFNSMHRIMTQEKGKTIVVYHSRTVYKEAKYYVMGKIHIFYCDVEPYYIVSSYDKLYVIINCETHSAQRLYFRVMMEFILRAKELMGYHLIHAASVKINGKGILICGNKGSGKTTLLSHLLRSGCAEFIANDKVFLSSDLSQIEYYPLAARVGEGTVNRFKEYNLEQLYHRISEEEKKKPKENLSNEKWEFTPREMAQIFDCNYEPGAHFSIMLMPQINNNKLVEIFDQETNILDYDLFKSDSKFKIPNWLLNDFWTEYFKIQRGNLQEMDENKYISYELKYGYDSSSKDIFKTIVDAI